MLGGYYHRLAKEANKSRGNKQKHLFPNDQPQFGGTLSNSANAAGQGYVSGVYDTKIQHIANSTTMQTVSSSLAIALTDFEASQSRSALLGGLGFVKIDSDLLGLGPELPSPRHQTFTKSYQISGHCFRGGDESTVASEEPGHDDNASTSSNASLTRLQFVVTSIYGLREAARFKTVPFEHYSSRLLMISIGPNICG